MNSLLLGAGVLIVSAGVGIWIYSQWLRRSVRNAVYAAGEAPANAADQRVVQAQAANAQAAEPAQAANAAAGQAKQVPAYQSGKGRERLEAARDKHNQRIEKSGGQ